MIFLEGEPSLHRRQEPMCEEVEVFLIRRLAESENHGALRGRGGGATQTTRQIQIFLLDSGCKMIARCLNPQALRPPPNVARALAPHAAQRQPWASRASSTSITFSKLPFLEPFQSTESILKRV